MKRSFILIGMVALCLNLFAKVAHTCYEYREVFDDLNSPVQFTPDWFEHLELADNNEEYGYDEEFLQEHGGRAGKLIFQSLERECIHENNENDSVNISCYGGLCSGTLIGNHYFLTAGHCDLEGISAKNVGVLFGYQMADFEDEYDDDDDEISDDDSDTQNYPRVSLNGYLNDNYTMILNQNIQTLKNIRHTFP